MEKAQKAKKEMLQNLSVATEAMESFVSSQKKFTAALAELDISLKTDDAETGGKRKRVAKLPKDPDAPKRPASSYLLFQNEIRAQLKEENPNMNNSDLVKHISARWASMTAEDKTVWNSRSDLLKKKYDTDFAAYAAKHPEKELKKTKKEKSAPAKPAQPAQAPSAKPPSKKPVAPAPAVAATSTEASSESSEESSEEEAPAHPVKKQQQQQQQQQQESSGEEESDDQEEDEVESSEEEEVVVQPVRKKAKAESSKRK